MQPNLKTFLIKSSLFLGAVFLFPAIELFCFQPAAFSFRAWEALSPPLQSEFLPGPFYPNLKFQTTEKGDLAHRMPDAVPKKTYWEIDRYGFRNYQELLKKPIHGVIVGDSTAAGTSLSQEETLSEQATRISKSNFYSYAPSGLQAFLEDSRIRSLVSSHSKWVVYAFMERNIAQNSYCPKEISPTSTDYWIQISHFLPALPRDWILNPLSIWTVSTLNRFFYLPTYKALQARLHDFGTSRRALASVAIHHDYFLQGPAALQDLPESDIINFVSAMKCFQKHFKSRGLELVVMPIPNKESYYYSYWQKSPPQNLLRLAKELEKSEIRQINLMRSYLVHQQDYYSIPLYHSDDTHWNASGVRIAAERIATLISEE